MSNRIRLQPRDRPAPPGPVRSSDPDELQTAGQAQAEQATLGAMLLDPATIPTVTAHLQPGDYYQPRHGTIHQAITALADEGTHPDALTVLARLAAAGELRPGHLDGPYLHTCIAAVPTTANAGHYAAAVADQAHRRHLAEAGARLNHYATIDDPTLRSKLVQDLTDHLTQAPGTGPGTVPAGLVARLDWRDLWTQATTDIRWEVEPLAERGQSVAIFSEPKTGKSLLCLELACALAAGRCVLGNPAQEPRRVVYVDYENTQTDLHDRLTALGYQPDELDNLIYLSFPPFAPLDTATGGRALVDTVTHYQGQVVIIDTASRVVEGSENDADTWNALYRHALVPLKAAGITVIRLDHTGKDPTRGQRGSSAKDGDVDAVWRLAARTPTSLYLKRERTRTGRGEGFVEIARRFEPLRHEVAHAGAGPSMVVTLIAQMDALGLTDDIGREKARVELAKAGIKARTDVLGAAIRERKERILLTSPIRLNSPNEDQEELSPSRGQKTQNPRSNLTQTPGTAWVSPGPATPSIPDPNPVPLYGGQGSGGTGPVVDQERTLVSCKICYGPLDDVSQTGTHPACEPDGEREWYP